MEETTTPPQDLDTQIHGHLIARGERVRRESNAQWSGEGATSSLALCRAALALADALREKGEI